MYLSYSTNTRTTRCLLLFLPVVQNKEIQVVAYSPSTKSINHTFSG
jgi:hypothetical protein